MQNISEKINIFFEQIAKYISIPKINLRFVDLIEILIIAVLFYHILIWFKTTRAWNLFKGILVVLVFVMLAAVFQMSTILWLAQNTFNVGLIALVIIFQPELRHALENIGGRNIFGHFFEFGKVDEGKISDKTIEELVKASYAMGKVKTGALIVIEDEIRLEEYIRTGIDIDGVVSSQLLINIFEKNTPLHDGAVVIRGNRIVSATCYLPLSDSLTLSKDLGTRHRAAVGISESSDSVTIVVSEETGKVSVASKGQIHHDISADFLRDYLQYTQNKKHEVTGIELLRRRIKNGKKASEKLSK